MTTLQIKSIAVLVISILMYTTTFSQEVKYVDKEEFFTGQKRHVLKANFVGNFIGTTKISYEQVIKPGRSFELKTTIVDGGKQGAFGSIGYKIYKKPTFVAPGMQRRNVLEGAYLKPEVFIGRSKDENFFDSNSEAETSMGLVLNIGKQWVFGDFFVIDTFIGTGVSNGNHVRGYLAGSGLVLTAGLNFGFAF